MRLAVYHFIDKTHITILSPSQIEFGTELTPKAVLFVILESYSILSIFRAMSNSYYTVDGSFISFYWINQINLYFLNIPYLSTNQGNLPSIWVNTTFPTSINKTIKKQKHIKNWTNRIKKYNVPFRLYQAHLGLRGWLVFHIDRKRTGLSP